MITEDYVSFDTAKLLKEKGFDGMCAYINYPPSGRSLIGHSINNTDLQLTREAELCIDKENLLTIPTLQMAMKWLREKHSIHCQIDCPIVVSNWRFGIRDLDKDEWVTEYRNNGNCDSYEEACEEAIKYCLENLI